MIRRVFVAAAAAWGAALLIAPVVAHRPDAGPIPIGFAYTVYSIGHVVCHQLPERSFQLQSVPMPVCARCTGIYLGAALAAVMVAARAPRDRTVRTILAVAALPTLATLAYEWTTGDMPSHWARAAAGAPLGAAVAWIIRDVN